jgi:hypothetical protein
MPLEGHWRRLQTPIRKTTRREGRVVAIASALLAVGVAVVLYAALQSGSSEAGPGCVNVTAAHSTGGATLHACGKAAARWCHSAATRSDALARDLRRECRKAGYD